MSTVPLPTRRPLRQWTVFSLSPLESRLLVLVVAGWLLFTLPSALFSQWFPLDLPRLFEMGADLHKSLPWILSPYNGAGRYFPAYWLFWALQYPLFGGTVWPYLLLQSVIFLAGAALVSLILYRITRSALAALLLFGAIYLASPIAENLTTIGKAEPLSLVFVICIVTLFHFAEVRGSRRLPRFAAMAVLFALAVWVKETAIVLLGFAAVGAAVAAGLRKLGPKSGDAPDVRPWFALLASLVAGLAITRIPYVVFSKQAVGSAIDKAYTNYQITLEKIGENAWFYLTQQPDVLFTGLLASVLLFLTLRNLVKDKTRLPAGGTNHLVLMCAICGMGWGYYLTLLIWRWPMAYYMLLPSVAFKVSGIYAVWLHLRHARWHRWQRNAVFCSLAIASLYGAVVVYYVTGSQIAYSRIYTRALRQVDELLAPGQRLVLENYPYFSEQVGGTWEMFDSHLKKTIPVAGIGDVVDPAVLNEDLLQLLNITDAEIAKNVEQVPRRGDLLLVFTGAKLGHWFLRGVTPFFRPDSLLREQGNYDMELVGGTEDVMVTPSINVWNWQPQFGSTWLGYKLYRIVGDQRYLWAGRFPDGWVGAKSTLFVNPGYGKPVTLAVSAPEYVLPVTVTIHGPGGAERTLELKTPDEVTVDLAPVPTASTTFTLDVSKTFVPYKLGLNKDKRKLGVRVSLVQGAPEGPRVAGGALPQAAAAESAR